MSQVFNKLYLDVRLNNKDIMTEAVQGDTNSRFLDVYLTDNGVPINLTGHEVRLYGVKGDTTEFYNNGAIIEATNGRCQFELTSQALSAANDIKAQVVIYYNNVQTLQTDQFTIKVTQSLISEGAVESSNEYGALVVLFQELYEAKDLMTTMTQNQGTKGSIATARGLNTFWQVMEYVAKYMDTDLTNLLNYVLENADVIGVINRLGETTDTGGTATAGTVMGKLNNITSRAVLPGIKTVSVGTSGTTTTINGSGLFFWISTGSNLNSCVITIDGIEVSASSIGNGAKYCLSAGSVGGAIALTQISTTAQAIPIPFNSSLIIKAPYNVSTDIVYALNS